MSDETFQDYYISIPKHWGTEELKAANKAFNYQKKKIQSLKEKLKEADEDIVMTATAYEVKLQSLLSIDSHEEVMENAKDWLTQNNQTKGNK